MKKIIFILLALAFFRVNAQSYQYVPFPTGNTVWSEYYKSAEQQSYPWIYTYYDKIAMTGEDTTINGKVYKKLYTFNDSVFNINNATYLGGIREENKKIYYYGDTIHEYKPFFSFQEVLLYDFTLNIEDTLPSALNFYCNFLAYDPPLIVSEIDTVLLGNKLRKVFKFYNEPGISWIEGIGSIKGLLFYTSNLHVTGSDPNGTLICFKQNDTIIYFNNNYSECMPLNINENNVMNENIVVSPNPATNYLTIKSGIIQPFTFQLYNMQGTALLAGKTSNTQTELNVANLPRGLYVLKIITNNQSVAKKIVLQ